MNEEPTQSSTTRNLNLFAADSKQGDGLASFLPGREVNEANIEDNFLVEYLSKEGSAYVAKEDNYCSSANSTQNESFNLDDLDVNQQEELNIECDLTGESLSPFKSHCHMQLNTNLINKLNASDYFTLAISNRSVPRETASENMFTLSNLLIEYACDNTSLFLRQKPVILIFKEAILFLK